MAQSKDKLRVITLNTHSLLEPDTDFCLCALRDAILQEGADIIALQEVNQPMDAPEADAGLLRACGYQPVAQDMPIRQGNFALMLVQRLADAGRPFHWIWVYNHCGYGRFDEGVALLSREPFLETKSLLLSEPGARCERVAAAVKVGERWFASVHMGWWKDPEDPFSRQWERLNAFAQLHPGTHMLMGDFNNSASVRDEGYDLILQSGWLDCHLCATAHDAGITVGGQIDGWRREAVQPMRIDFIFSNHPRNIASSSVLFDGKARPMISDHCGLLMEESLE